MADLITNRDAQQDIRTELDNLDDLHRRLLHMMACGYIHAEELADLVSRNDPSAAILPEHFDLTEYHEKPILSSPAYKDLSPGQLRAISHLYPQLTAAEQLCFYRTLTGAPNRPPAAMAERLLGHTESVELSARGTIAYQHSIYTDEAFLHFSRVLPAARAVYAENFSGVCEQVFNGICEYCILPLENSQDGKLVRFYQLIEKYELKIVLTCHVTTSDNRNSTVFGLCRRGLSFPALLLPDRSFWFEFVFWQEPERSTLGEVLTAAAACSLSLVRADCLPRSDEEILIGAGYPFDLCFEATPETGGHDAAVRDFLAFLLYLSVHSPTYLPLGIYQRL